MKKSFALNALIFFVFAMLISKVGWSQDQDKSKRPSPPATATGKIGDATITINYSSPSVKGRQIWGALEPYDSVWRAGANEATTFETNKDIMVEGKKLPAGKYAFFTIPTPNDWTIIFNKVPNQWGAFKYDKNQDALRVTVTPRKGPFQEKLNYAVNNNGIVLSWENLQIPVSIK